MAGVELGQSSSVNGGPVKQHQAYIGFGSNLGQRVATCTLALERLAELPDCRLLKVSPLYETAPVGCGNQPAFINGIALVGTSIPPRALLGHLLSIERELGRVRQRRWGPRTIDLDLLLYDNLICSDAELTLPHPRLHQRLFVLQPLSDLAPDLVHPVLGISMRELLLMVDDPTQEIRPYEGQCSD